MNNIDVGIGYRLLEIGETIKEGDEFLSDNYKNIWDKSSGVGEKQMWGWYPRRRSIRPWDNNYYRNYYRFLDDEETVKLGDELCVKGCELNPNCWIEITKPERGLVETIVLIHTGFSFRRRITKAELKVSCAEINTWIDTDSNLSDINTNKKYLAQYRDGTLILVNGDHLIKYADKKYPNHIIRYFKLIEPPSSPNPDKEAFEKWLEGKKDDKDCFMIECWNAALNYARSNK